jgi:hypothetical protein
MRLAGHVAYIGGMINVYRLLRDHFGDLGIDCTIILKWILNK